MIPLFPCVFTEGHITDSYYPLCDENGACLSELRVNLQYVEIESPIGLQKQAEDAIKVHRTIFDSLNTSKRVYYSIAQSQSTSHRNYGQYVALGACTQRFIKSATLMNKYFRNIKRQTIVEIFNDYVVNRNERQCKQTAKTDQINISWEIYLNIISKVFMVLGVSINAYRLGNKSHSSVNAPVDKGSKKTAVDYRGNRENSNKTEGIQMCEQALAQVYH